MQLTLQLGGQTLGRVESLDLSTVHAGHGTAERWQAKLLLSAATPALAEAALAALQARVGETGGLKLLAGATVLRELATAQCRQGPRLVSVEAASPMPEAAHGTRHVELTLEAALQDADSAVQSHQFTVSLLRVAGAPERLITRGRVVLRAAENPASHEATAIAAPATGMRRVRTATTRDTAAPSLEYETEDEQVFAPLPAGVDDGHVIRALVTTPEGRRVQVTSGFFAGAGALARAFELQPAGALHARVAVNEQARRVEFEYHELLSQPLHAGLLARTETLSFVTSRRVIDHALLGPGLPAWRQQVGAAVTEITQEGSAVGETRHPAPPAPLYAADVIERRVEYSFPDPALPADRRFVTRWRILMRARAERPATAPETP